MSAGGGFDGKTERGIWGRRVMLVLVLVLDVGDILWWGDEAGL